MARRWSTLQGSALLGAALLGYGCYALGDWRFVLPPAGLFLSHLVTTHRLGIVGHLEHGMDAIGSLSISAFPWLLAKAAGLIDPEVALLAFAGSFATHLAIMHCSTATWSGKRHPGCRGGLVKGCALGLAPVTLVVALTDNPVDSPARLAIALLLATAPILLATTAYNRCRARFGKQGDPLWTVEAGLALAASLGVFGILHLLAPASP